MLASVLRSDKAAEVNIEIVRAFVRIRKFFLSNAELLQRLHELESRYDRQFRAVFDAIRRLMDDGVVPAKRRIGFGRDGET